MKTARKLVALKLRIFSPKSWPKAIFTALQRAM